MAKKVRIYDLSEPLNGVKTAKAEINTGSGNLVIGKLTGNGRFLVKGTLEYLEKQDFPTKILDLRNSRATLTIKAGSGKKSWFRFPWAACNGATDWRIQLNPTIPSDIVAYSGGGNVSLNLAGMNVTGVVADTGGGNVEVILPSNATNLDVSAKTGGGNVVVEIGNGTSGSNTVNAGSGAGNVEVRVPKEMAVRIHANSGLGKVIMDPNFGKTGETEYQSSDYDSSVNKVELTVKSGAGNVSVRRK